MPYVGRSSFLHVPVAELIFVGEDVSMPYVGRSSFLQRQTRSRYWICKYCVNALCRAFFISTLTSGNPWFYGVVEANFANLFFILQKIGKNRLIFWLFEKIQYIEYILSYFPICRNVINHISSLVYHTSKLLALFFQKYVSYSFIFVTLPW